METVGNQFNAIVNRINSVLQQGLYVVDENEFLSNALLVLLVMYAALVAPNLSENVASIFDNVFFRLFVFFIIAFTATTNPSVAILLAICTLVSLHTLTSHKVDRKMMTLVQNQVAVPGNNNMVVVNEEPVINSVALEEEENSMMEDLTNLQEVGQDPTTGACLDNADFRDNFYPQYVNMKPDAYMSRYTGEDVSGYSE
jgi:hypothetical protein